MTENFIVDVLTTGDDLFSTFIECEMEGNDRNGMLLSDQIKSINLRLRKSAAGYSSDWHLAGDPTLILIQSGTLRISLRDNSFKDFSAGDYFVAQDTLPENIVFDPVQHGHRANVIGGEVLQAVHIKLKNCLE